MQVVGTKVVDEALDAVSARSARPVVSEWANRVLRRHVRREQSLMVRIEDARKLSAVLKADGMPEAGRARVTAAFKAGEPIYSPSKEAVQAFVVRASDTMDWIESLPESDRRIRRIERMAWSDAEKLAEAWHAALAKARKVSSKIMEGVRKLADLDDGAFAGELTTAAALKAEGAAMGHCVGGYWQRVQEGGTRIVSIRDGEGHPHVTIELSSAPVLRFEDGTQMVASKRPANGVDTVTEAVHPWVAVQVRGKQNKQPVPRYMSKVVQWLQLAGIPWVEFGEMRFGGHGDPLEVYSSYGRHFRTVDAACNFAEPLVAGAVRKNKPFKGIYVDSGLAALHRLAEPERVVSFLEASIPAIIAEVGKGSTAHKAMFSSGLDIVMDNLPKGRLALPVRNRILNAVIKADAQEVSQETRVLAAVPGSSDLRLVVHSVPLAPMVLLASGYGHGIEERILEVAAPYLRTVAANVLADPAAVHAVRSSSDGIGADDMKKAFLVCGLAAELAVMSSRVEQQVASLVSASRPALRKARATGKFDVEVLNQSSNLLAEGYERRVAGRVADIVHGPFLLLSAQERKATPVHAARLQADPVVKRYRMP